MGVGIFCVSSLVYLTAAGAGGDDMGGKMHDF